MNRRTLLRALPAALALLVPGLRRSVVAQDGPEMILGDLACPTDLEWVDWESGLSADEWGGKVITFPLDPVVIDKVAIYANDPESFYRTLALVMPKPTIVETEHGKAWQYDYTFGGEG